MSTAAKEWAGVAREIKFINELQSPDQLSNNKNMPEHAAAAAPCAFEGESRRDAFNDGLR